MDCPKCQSPINIRKRMTCENCGYNVLSKPTTEQNQESAEEQKPTPIKKPKPDPEKRTIWQWYVKCWKEMVNFQGRARRAEYWSFTLVNLLFLIPLLILGLALGGKNIVLIVAVAYYLAIIVPHLAVTVRRLHDSGRTGWWVFASAVLGGVANLMPFFLSLGSSLIFAVIMLGFLVSDSDYGTNKWGDSPKYPDGKEKVLPKRKSDRFDW